VIAVVGGQILIIETLEMDKVQFQQRSLCLLGKAAFTIKPFEGDWEKSK
jgi:hypothetical protein